MDDKQPLYDSTIGIDLAIETRNPTVIAVYKDNQIIEILEQKHADWSDRDRWIEGALNKYHDKGFKFNVRMDTPQSQWRMVEIVKIDDSQQRERFFQGLRDALASHTLVVPNHYDPARHEWAVALSYKIQPGIRVVEKWF